MYLKNKFEKQEGKNKNFFCNLQKKRGGGKVFDKIIYHTAHSNGHLLIICNLQIIYSAFLQFAILDCVIRNNFLNYQSSYQMTFYQRNSLKLQEKCFSKLIMHY